MGFDDAIKFIDRLDVCEVNEMVHIHCAAAGAASLVCQTLCCKRQQCEDALEQEDIEREERRLALEEKELDLEWRRLELEKKRVGLEERKLDCKARRQC